MLHQRAPPLQRCQFFWLRLLFRPTITFCLRWLDEELVLMGLEGLSTCRGTVVKTERLFKVSRSPLTDLKLHFISLEKQLRLRRQACGSDGREESSLAPVWQRDYKRVKLRTGFEYNVILYWSSALKLSLHAPHQGQRRGVGGRTAPSRTQRALRRNRCTKARLQLKDELSEHEPTLPPLKRGCVV